MTSLVTSALAPPALQERDVSLVRAPLREPQNPREQSGEQAKGQIEGHGRDRCGTGTLGGHPNHRYNHGSH